MYLFKVHNILNQTTFLVEIGKRDRSLKALKRAIEDRGSLP